MMEKTKLRGVDIITSGLFFLVGCYVIAEALTMPLTDSYAGVDSVWYVSPALMPLIIGLAMILLSISIFRHAVKNGGWITFKAMFKKGTKKEILSESNIRYAGILVPLCSLVYLNLTRIDFFLSLVLFLIITIAIFYLDDPLIMRKGIYLYTAEMGLILILAIFGLDKILKSFFIYSLDIIAVLMIASITVFLWIAVRKSGNAEYRKKFSKIMWVTWLTPLFVVPIFRFMLRVPLPVEGAIVNLMSLFYYSVR